MPDRSPLYSEVNQLDLMAELRRDPPFPPAPIGLQDHPAHPAIRGRDACIGGTGSVAVVISTFAVVAALVSARTGGSSGTLLASLSRSLRVPPRESLACLRSERTVRRTGPKPRPSGAADDSAVIRDRSMPRWNRRRSQPSSSPWGPSGWPSPGAWRWRP